MLHLPTTASSAEIRKSYRVLSLKLHPDKVGKDVSPEEASRRFDLLHKAYELLSDPATREALAKKAEEEAQRRERTGKFEAERKKMTDELERREREQQDRRRKEQMAAKQRERDLDRLKEEGRRLREQKSKSNAAAAAQQQAEKEHQAEQKVQFDDTDNSASSNADVNEPALGPLDTTVRLLYPQEFDAVLSGIIERICEQYFGPLVHYKRLPPPTTDRASDDAKKRKRPGEVVCLATFADLKPALRLVETASDFQLRKAIGSAGDRDHQDLDEIWVEWAAAKEIRKKREKAKKTGQPFDEKQPAGNRIGEPAKVTYWRSYRPDEVQTAIDGKHSTQGERLPRPAQPTLAEPNHTPPKPASFEADVLKRAMAAAEAKRKAAAAASATSTETS